MRVILDGGETIDLGTTETTPTIGITDYSKRVTDDFGVTTVVERGFSRRMSVRVAVAFDAVDTIQRQLAELRATTAMWVADDRFAWLKARGFYKDFDLDVATQPLSYCTLTVEGLAETETAADPGGDPAPEGQASTLQLLQPVTVTDGVLAASTVAENDYPAWSATATYAKGARVVRAHRSWESLIAGNTADPLVGAWLDVGPTNRWAMFDQALGSVTTANGSISVTLTAAMTAIALLDVVGATVRVQATGYDQTLAVGPGAVTFLDMPASTQATVTISGAGAVSVGTLLAGKVVALGITEASPSAGITDYSRKVVDDFGEVTVVQRAWAKRMTARALIRTDAIDVVANRIAAVRAVPSLWIGQSGMDSLTVYGFFKDFSIEVGENVSKLSLSIEGLSAAAKVEPLKVAIDWEAVGNAAGTKPANNATVGGTVGTNIKRPDGAVAAPGELLNSALSLTVDGQLAVTIGGVKTLLGKVTLPDLGAATEASRRKLDADLAGLSAAVAQLAAGQAIVQNVFRDAGLYTDPAAGIAKFFAIEKRAEQITNLAVTLNAALGTIGLKADVNYVDQAILKAQLSGQTTDLNSIFVRLSSAEANISGLQATVQLKADATVVSGLQGVVSSVVTTLDALSAVVATKASQTVVDAQGQRLTLAEQTISAFDGAAISQAVTASRRAPGDSDAAGATTILDLLNAAQGSQAAQAGIAAARTELGARVTGAFDAIASLSVQLGVQIGSVTALVGQATTAQIAGDAAIASQIETYQASTSSSLATVNQALVAQGDTNSAVAGMLQSFSTTVGGHSNTLTVFAQSIDGLGGKYGAEFNQDGDFTGFALLNGQGRTDAAFLVSSFKIAIPKAGGGSLAKTVFHVAADGVIEMPDVRITNLAADSITAREIKGSAVQKVSVFKTTGDIVIPVGV